ncbi:MAG: M12 family metallo-peptidase [Anaeromyxobacter sp.]
MAPRRLAAALLLAGSTASALAGSAASVLAVGCSWSRTSRQREAVEATRPAGLRPRSAAGGPAQAYRVRVHVDADYRAQVKAWRERIPAQLERVNALLGPDLGVRLELASIEPWERIALRAGLRAAVDELLLEDPGDGADWVIGYVGRQRSGGFLDPTGLAPLFSRHMLVTAPEDAEDVQAVNVALDQLTTAEREAVRAAAREHLEDVAFLHELGHTLGAVHECAVASIMSAQTTPVTSGFSEATLVLARLGLERRLAAGAAGRAAWRERWHRARREELAGEAFECVALDEGLAAEGALVDREPGSPREERAQALAREVTLRFRVGVRLAEAELPRQAVHLRITFPPGAPPAVSRAGSTGSAAADAALDRVAAALRPAAGPEGPPDGPEALEVPVPPEVLRTHLRR